MKKNKYLLNDPSYVHKVAVLHEHDILYYMLHCTDAISYSSN